VTVLGRTMASSRSAVSIWVTVPESSTVTRARSPVFNVTVFFVARWRRKLNPWGTHSPDSVRSFTAHPVLSWSARSFVARGAVYPDTGARMDGMTDADVVAEKLILVDANGNLTEDRDAAVRGEVVQTLADGTTRSTVFNVERATGR